MLRRFPVHPTSLEFGMVVDNIIHQALRIGNSDSNMGRQVLPLSVYIINKVTQNIRERDSLRRALAESALSGSNGMVPANESSAKKMLKRVRVEDEDEYEGSRKKRRVKGEDCVICLEEIEVGSTASRMPCSHTFHDHCIEKWPKESYYCPLCRFEMPT
ncbi:putative Calcineurin-like metallo-phosphoesterase superfamily protein [Hibiscus syriacus]|uniref:RING-type E3 ubiquitin transferase n=1 Tax=Hibiscus syriacus TaxID=106335 RepID=A0A6A3AUH6_HIBSY|nr:E3 ubiquitin-protein ligase MPSR1-like [Hibiscus syriacus]KAE8707363.1 putative Calcineurin-like metallo-phosphoesterase superfamily protein [Hibiscus syriacus]